MIMPIASAACQMVEYTEGQGVLIAVVDDSALMRKVMGYSLRRAGFRVQDFADGVALLQALREVGAEMPKLILLDIGLPKMNGYQVARALKGQERMAGCAIVMVSRRNGLLDRLKGRLAGACDWLSKPFTTADLLAVVRAVLAHDRGSEEVVLPACLCTVDESAQSSSSSEER